MDDWQQQFDKERRERQAAFVKLLHENGRPDLVADYERDMRSIADGTHGAGSTWYSISKKQRAILRVLERCPFLIRSRGNCYDAVSVHKIERGIADLRSLRPLSARGLIHPDGPIFDVEERFALTEHGMFVICHGPRNAWRWGKCKD